MKTLLQMEMYYVREYTPTCRTRYTTLCDKGQWYSPGFHHQ